MKDWKQLEGVLDAALRRYEEIHNQYNTEAELKFAVSITNHKVMVQGTNKWCAYLRLDRLLRPKGGDDNQWEPLLIYNQSYRFENTQERLNPDTPWKYDLYQDCIYRLIAGGVEYGETLKRIQNAQKKQNEITVPKIEVTNQMPAPLTEDEQKYKQWVDTHREK